ncbi:MAG: PIN domain-containing protein [Thermoleophilia bacterium]
MTLTLLDTSALISVERSRGRLDEVILDDDEPALSAITIAELRVGVELGSGRRRKEREAFIGWIEQNVPTVPYDGEVAHAHAKLIAHCRRGGTQRSAHDLMIAATGSATGRTIVTLDRNGFADLPNVRVR